MKLFSSLIQWLIMLAVVVGIVYAFKYAHVPDITLTHAQVIILAFSFAFVWVYVLKWGSVRPFNCITCMAGWASLIIGCWSIGLWGWAYMPVGMTVGALYAEIRQRWL